MSATQTPKAPLTFTVQSEKGHARAGRIETARHGGFDTPVFMPVGTLGAVKSLDAGDMNALGARIMLSNAYHLMLRPGDEDVAALGGLHRMMNYDGAVLTDSGGFQVYSLAKMRKVTDEGVTFRAHTDGRLVHLNAERLVQLQERLGPDIAMVIDECPPGGADRETVKRAMARTTAWAARCLAAKTRDDMAWFGIVQGGCFSDLREAHLAAIGALPFDGIAIGGVSVGEPAADIERVVREIAPQLPANKPRYLMGVGTPADLIRGVASGVDMFDCVMPSRNARNGSLFTRQGRLSIKNAKHRLSTGPICDACPCSTCKTYTRAYLRHLFVAGELTYFRLATLHNLTFYLGLMQRIRAAIVNQTFSEAAFLEEVGMGRHA